MTQQFAELDRARQHAESYLRDIAQQRVSPAAETLEALDAWRPVLPEGGTDPAEVVDELAAWQPATVASAGPRHFGYVMGGTLPATVAANWLATAWDQAPADYRLSPLSVALERIAGEWLVDLLRLPKGSAVNYLTGSTMGSFVGIAAARSELLARQGWDVSARGLQGAPPIRVVASAEAHSTVFKALSMLGLGNQTAVRVPTDRQGRLIAAELPEIGPDTIVCVQAGNVNSGSFDPFSEVCAKASAAGAWVHIDGAFGLLAAASPDHDHLLAGHDLADSWAIDGHKWLNTPYDCGISICRHPDAVRRAFGYSAAYLEDDDRNPRNSVPELSRRARSIEVWAALRSLGRSGVRDLVQRNCAQARRFATGLERLGFTVLNDVVLGQVLAGLDFEDRVEAVVRHVQDSGVAWFSTTKWKGRTALRINCTNWRTTDADVDLTLEAIATALRETG